jgi:DNA-binding protein H-NS
MPFNRYELSTLSVDELWSLHEEIGALLSDRILDQKRTLEQRLAQLRGPQDGLASATESRPAKSRKLRRKYPKVLPRYRNPETNETWSGRGKQPRWIISAVAAGRSMEEFRIST